MTTLPTRKDGGIRWHDISFDDHRLVFWWLNRRSEKVVVRQNDFGPLVAAHERERCAMWHDKKEAFYLSIQSVYQARMHRESAAGLRKLEV